jgi:protein ImuB
VLWIGLFFPHLPLQALNRLGDAQGGVKLNDAVTFPAVVTQGPDNRPAVMAVNKTARQCGITLGMTLASAKVLHHELIALRRDTPKERRCLERIAMWCLQFTPNVVIDEDIDRHSINLEVSASITLFGGLTRLIERIKKGMVKLGYMARLGVAPTALAAALLARMAKRAPQMAEAGELPAALARVPVREFAWPASTQSTLFTLGLTTVADVLRQPRAGLRRRFGDGVMRDLDRAHGLVDAPFQPFRAPEQFSSHIDFLFEIKEVERLRVPIGELLTQFEGFLRARGVGANEIHLELKQGRERLQSFTLRSRAPVRNAAQWMRLLHDRLSAVPLEHPVIEVRLHAERFLLQQEITDSLLPQARATHDEWCALLDRINSHVGEQKIYCIALVDEHRPEWAWQKTEIDCASNNKTSMAQKSRPLWLLTPAQPLDDVAGNPQHHGALSLLAGPERIDTGWWDGKPVVRDYFIAKNTQHQVCWIYRDYREKKRWFLHGYFS